MSASAAPGDPADDVVGGAAADERDAVVGLAAEMLWWDPCFVPRFRR